MAKTLRMSKFLLWIKMTDKKQRGVAEKLHISLSTLHDILRKGHMPSLKLAYEIEKYTKGAVTLYDWIDQEREEEENVHSLGEGKDKDTNRTTNKKKAIINKT